MKVVDFDGKTYNWPRKTRKQSYRSHLHERAIVFLRNKFPTYVILEEVEIPLKPPLYLDIYIPLLKTAIECHGQQHDEFSRFYHKTLKQYIKYQDNDFIKAEWCKLNGITLLEFRQTETNEQWESKLN